jgi:hypothetical protein
MLCYGSSDTEAALDGLRDLSTLQWFVIPLLAIVFYIYAFEIKKAKQTGNWNVILCGLTVFGMDFFNETWNGWVCWFTQDQAFWTTPGPTALRVMVGWNIEIIFMFLINGIVFGHFLEDNADAKILGLNNRWFYAIFLAVFCVFIEIVLNLAGMLTWVYPFWNRTLGGVWLIFLIGYFHFYVACIIILKIKSPNKRWLAIAGIYMVPIIMNLIAFSMGMVY